MNEQQDINPSPGNESPPGSDLEQEGVPHVTLPIDLPSDFDLPPGLGTALLGTNLQLRLYANGFPEPISVTLSDVVILGRGDPKSNMQPTVSLNDYGASEAGVSRQHTALWAEQRFIKVMDLSSSNGTYLNGRKLVAYQPRLLRDGDELRLGNLLVRVRFG